MSASTPSQAQLRPFRIVAWAFYLVVAVGFSLTVTISVVRSLRGMVPPERTSSAQLDTKACVDRLRVHSQALESERRTLGELKAEDIQPKWLEFRMGWMNKVRDTEASCSGAIENNQALREAFAGVWSSMDHYTTHMVQFRTQLAPSTEKLQEQLKQALSK